MSVDLGAAFKAGTTGAGYPGGERDEDEEATGLTELVKFSPERIDGVADPASGFPVLLIKSLPRPPAGRPVVPVSRPAVSRPVPAASVKAARKAARRLAKAEAVRHEQAAAQVRRALREVVADELGDLRARAAAVRRRIEDIEVQRGVRPAAGQEVSTESWAVKGATGGRVAVAKSAGQARRFADEYDAACAGRASAAVRERVVKRMNAAAAGGGSRHCGTCGRYSKALTADHRFCSKCGASLAKGAAAGVDAGRPRCWGCGLLNAAGADDCSRCGYSLSGAADDDGELDKSFTCGGCKSQVYSDRDTCPFCGRIAGVAKSAGLSGVGVAEGLAGVVRKATQSPDSNERAAAIGKLMQAVGREATAMVLTGAMSPQQFTRAFLSRGRAPLSAPAGQSPRIPDARAISSDDFRRPALSAGHQRPSQLLDRLNALMEPGGGQAVGYRSSPGIAPRDPYEPSSGQPNSSTVAPGLARANAARGAFSNPPMPGDARPW